MKAKNYRRTEGMSYTRSEFIHGAPASRITKYTGGSINDNQSHEVSLHATMNMQIRDIALESARIAAGKLLTSKLGENFFLEIAAHPHIVLRENKMIFGAHADRLQEGMRRAFGKPVGRAARVRAGQAVIRVRVVENGLAAAREAMELASKKLPKKYTITVSELAKGMVSGPSPEATSPSSQPA